MTRSGPARWRPTRILWHPGWSALAGTALGAAIAAGLTVAGIPARGGRPVPAQSASAAFLSAWRAHLERSWSVDQVDQRSTAGGTVLRFEIHVAQRPPDSVEVGGGTIAARRGATLIACATPPGVDHPVCRTAPAPLSWDQQVAVEMAALRRVLLGPRGLYRVSVRGPGCFAFVLRVPVATLPVTAERGATYCLDPSSGALLSSSRVGDGTTDRITTTSHHAPATDADLALPADATYG